MNSKPHEANPSEPAAGKPASQIRQRGYPLTAILLLTTAVATGLACIDIPEFRASLARDPGAVVGIYIVATVLAGLVGGLIGLGSDSRWRGSLKGLGLGLLIGGFLGILTMAPAHPIQAFVAVTVLVLASLAIRWHAV